MAGLYSLLARWLGGAAIRRTGIRAPLTCTLEVSGFTAGLTISGFTAGVAASGDVTGSIRG